MQINMQKIEIEKAEKYRVLKNIPKFGWVAGDIVEISGKISQDSFDNGLLEKYGGTEKHKHVLIGVDPIRIKPKVNIINQ